MRPTKANRRPRNVAAPSTSRDTTRAGKVLTLAEAAAFLRVSKEDVLQLVQEQGLPARRIGNDWRFLAAAVEGWLSAPAASDRAKFWETHFGALREDPHLVEVVREAYRKRGRAGDGEP
jgi:excisionase family DNA binding protein